MGRGQFHLDAATYLRAIRAEVRTYDEFQDAVAEAADFGPVQSILELGVGTGETSRRVLARHPAVTLRGVDASEQMLAVARESLPGADLSVARIEDPLPPGEYDLVFGALVVHHLPPAGKQDLFRRIRAVLRPQGRFVLADVIVPDRPEDAVTPLEPGVDLPDPLPDQLRWLAEAGFDARTTWQKDDLVVVAADADAQERTDAVSSLSSEPGPHRENSPSAAERRVRTRHAAGDSWSAVPSSATQGW